MNFTLDELINAIKYHGHQYGLSTLEILEGVAREYSEEVLENKYDEGFQAGEADNIENVEQKLDEILDERLDLIDDNEEITDDEKEARKDILREFYQEIKRKL